MGFAGFLKQSTSVVVSFGSFMLNSDGVTPVTNLVGTGSNQTENTSTGIRISKNGGAYAARHATAAASTYDANGDYLVTLDTTDTGTLGILKASFVNGAAFCPVEKTWMVMPANMWNSMFGTGGSIPDAAANAAGGLLVTAAGSLDMDELNVDIEAIQTSVATLNNLSQTDIRTAVGLASANLDTQLSEIEGETDAIATLNNLSQADIRTAVGMASANLDTQLAEIETETDDIAAVKNKTDNLPASPAAVGSAMTLTVGERNSISDAWTARNVAGGSSSGRTNGQSLATLRNKVTISGGTITVYDVDDTTVLWTGTVTTAPGDPLASIDPA